MIGHRVLPQRNLEPLQATHRPLREALVSSVSSMDDPTELGTVLLMTSSSHMLPVLVWEGFACLIRLNEYRRCYCIMRFICFLRIRQDEERESYIDKNPRVML